MGVGTAGHFQARLLNAGIDASTPVTLVENGTLAQERVFDTAIGELQRTVKAHKVTGPAMIYIGLSREKSAKLLPFSTMKAAS
jgi:siroheme synthase